MPPETPGLPFGPLGQNTLFVCIDMQRLFLEPGDWYCPDAADITPNCIALSQAAQDNAVFTRFTPAWSADDAPGRWRQYYQHWSSVTGARSGKELIEVIDPLQPFATPERTFDKATYGAFQSPSFAEYVSQTKPDGLALFGIETDVCILATVLTAVDLGLRVTLPVDALASSDAQSHEACLTHVYPRIDQQVELTDTQTVLRDWRGR